MRFLPSIPALALALSAALALAACAESDPAGPVEVAAVSGVVTAATGAAIQGATVTVGTATATTDADGRFELRDLPVGSVSISTSAPRFDARWETVTLVAGTNVHDVALTPQTLFTSGDVHAYLPPDKARYEVAIVFLPGLRDPVTGNPLDSRGLVRGATDGPCPIWCSVAEVAEIRSRSLELAGGNVALVGTTTLIENPASYGTLLHALSDLGTQSGRPELGSIPILFVGHSMGGCTAYGFSREYSARVAGFITMKGACHATGPAGAAATVPGFFLIGAADAAFRAENITAVFEAGRATGAPWAVGIDAYGHGPIVDLDLMFDWIRAVLAARLPDTPGAPLRPVVEADGWLGDRATGEISRYGCHRSSRSSASWLPSLEAALGWQRMTGGDVVVGSC